MTNPRLRTGRWTPDTVVYILDRWVATPVFHVRRWGYGFEPLEKDGKVYAVIRAECGRVLEEHEARWIRGLKEDRVLQVTGADRLGVLWIPIAHAYGFARRCRLCVKAEGRLDI